MMWLTFIFDKNSKFSVDFLAVVFDQVEKFARHVGVRHTRHSAQLAICLLKPTHQRGVVAQLCFSDEQWYHAKHGS